MARFHARRLDTETLLKRADTELRSVSPNDTVNEILPPPTIPLIFRFAFNFPPSVSIFLFYLWFSLMCNFFFPYVRPLSNIFFLFGFVKFECDVDYVCSLRGLWNDFEGIHWGSIFNFVIFVKGLFIIWTLIYYIRFRRKKIYSSKWDEKDYWKWYFFAVCFVYSISKINF